LVEFLEELLALKIDPYLHTQGLDTSTPTGRAMFQMAAVFGDWERAIIRDRVIASLARVKATAEPNQAERHGTDRAGLAKAKSSTPTAPGRSHKTARGLVTGRPSA